mgnify:CR=1 FL=1
MAAGPNALHATPACATVAASALPAWLQESASRLRGEFALVVQPRPPEVQAPAGEAERVLSLLLAELPLKSAVKLAGDITREPVAVEGEGDKLVVYYDRFRHEPEALRAFIERGLAIADVLVARAQ